MADLTSHFRRMAAANDQKLQVFKTFYLNCDDAERVKLLNLVRAVEAASDALLGINAPGVGGGCMAKVLCVLSTDDDDPAAEVEPCVLRKAMEAWDIGETFFSDGLDW